MVVFQVRVTNTATGGGTLYYLGDRVATGSHGAGRLRGLAGVVGWRKGFGTQGNQGTGQRHAYGTHSRHPQQGTRSDAHGSQGTVVTKGHRSQGTGPNAYTELDHAELIQGTELAARDPHLDLIRAPYVLYGVKFIDPVSLAPFPGA